MKIYTLFFIPALITLSAFIQADLKPVDANDAVTFIIRNFGINTKGELKGLKGSIHWNPNNISTSTFNVSVDVNTINTGIDSRDNHLRKEEYFNVAKYPAINFTSTSVNATTISGNLTIKGVTKQISFPYTVTQAGGNYVFEGSFSLNRLDYGVGSGSAVLGDNVNVSLKVTAKP